MPPRSRASDVPSELTDKDPAHMTDDELAQATSDAAHDAGTVVTLAVAHPYDALVLHDVLDEAGKAFELTADGTEVPADREDEIRKAAKAAGVPIRKVH